MLGSKHNPGASKRRSTLAIQSAKQAEAERLARLARAGATVVSAPIEAKTVRELVLRCGPHGLQGCAACAKPTPRPAKRESRDRFACDPGPALCGHPDHAGTDCRKVHEVTS